MTHANMTVKGSEAAESRTFRLSRRVSVTLTVGLGGLVVEWEPDMPERLTAKELRRYRVARADHDRLQRGVVARA